MQRKDYKLIIFRFCFQLPSASAKFQQKFYINYKKPVKIIILLLPRLNCFAELAYSCTQP